MTLSTLIVRGKTAQADLIDRVTSAQVSLSAALSPDDYAVSQLSLTIADPDLAIHNSHLFDRGASVRLGDLYCQVAAHGLDQPASGYAVKAEARSWGFEKLTNDRGVRTWQQVSVGDLARQVAEPFGLRVLAQPSPVVASLTRNGPDASKPGDRGESSAQMLLRYGKDLGYVLFEAYETLYFGQPTWLLTQLPVLPLDLSPGKRPDEVLELPSFRRTADEAGRDQRTMTMRVTRDLARRLSPGMGLKVTGVERFNTTYLISRVEYDEASNEAEGSVTAVLPVDPPVTAQASSTTTDQYGQPSIDGGQFGRFVNAIAGQESQGSGNYNAVNSSSGALGRYQVMPANVGPWSRQILGRTVTTAEFRRSPALQDQIAVGILWQMYQQHGARGAAAAWYSGKPERQNDYREPPNPSVGTYCDQVLAVMPGADSALPPGYTGAGTPSTTVALGKTATAFATLCQQQVDRGVPYVFGAEADVTNNAPGAFDCSELVQWAAGRLGVTVPDGSVAQWRFCQSKNTTLGIDVASRIRGALLFKINPFGGISHVAIAMGDGKHTIEAQSTKAGLVNSSITGRGWTGAAQLPGLAYPAGPYL